MKNLITVLAAVLLVLTVSCKKQGCTDPTADNYNEKSNGKGVCFHTNPNEGTFNGVDSSTPVTVNPSEGTAPVTVDPNKTFGFNVAVTDSTIVENGLGGTTLTTDFNHNGSVKYTLTNNDELTIDKTAPIGTELFSDRLRQGTTYTISTINCADNVSFDFEVKANLMINQNGETVVVYSAVVLPNSTTTNDSVGISFEFHNNTNSITIDILV